MTTYYKFKGQLLKEDDHSGEDVPVTADEGKHIIGHLFKAMDVYALQGWRFVDVAASATLAGDDPEVTMEWSDYGLTVPLVKESE